MSYPGQVFEDPDYYDDLDDEGNWVEVPCDKDGNPIEPAPSDVMAWLVNQLKDYDATYSPFDTINS